MRWINPLHLRTFYLVAHHGGISKSLPFFGYAIQQPAISEQLRELEARLGVHLLVRARFRESTLTDAGALLYRHLAPFFEALEPLLQQVALAGLPRLRIGAADVVFAEYFPAVLADLRAAAPDVQFHLQSGTPAERIAAVQRGALDLAIAAAAQAPKELAARVLLRLPVVLLVPERLRLGPDPARWPRPLPPLVVPTEPAILPARFEPWLESHGLTWRPQTILSSISLVSWYVANQGVVGLTLGLPKLIQHAGLRAIPLTIPAVEVSAYWRTPAAQLIDLLLAAMARHTPRLAR